MRKIDIAALKALTDRMPMQGVGDGQFIREMRDSDRYQASPSLQGRGGCALVDLSELPKFLDPIPKCP
jgi:hypothetical protein